MGAEETRQAVCGLRFDEKRFLDVSIGRSCEQRFFSSYDIAVIMERLLKDRRRVDVRFIVDGSRISPENIFDYTDDREPIFRGFGGNPKKLYCKGYMPGILDFNLAAHSFKFDDEGRLINMHGATVCTGCGYFLKGRKIEEK